MLQRFAVVLCAAALTVACGQTDAGITTAVKSKLAADTSVSAYEIDVTTRDGIVTLEGDVETSAAKEQAVAIARDTDGVRDVVDQLRVGDMAATTGIDEEMEAEGREAAHDTGETADRAGEAVTDAAITTAVKAKLLADTTVGGLDIDVDTNNGVVTLSGTVESRNEANQAVQLARDTEGVNRVVDQLKVGSGQ